MNREAQERLTAACDDDAVPGEMICGETTRIDQTALTGLIEKTVGIAVGTPRSGLPVLPDGPVIEMVADEPVETGSVVAVGEVEVEVLVVSEAVVVKRARGRDVLIGGLLSLLVMAAWYCATQL